MSTAQITIPLDIPDVRVLQTQLTAHGEFIITVESTLLSARCHRCGRMIRKSHGYDDWVTVQHLPILGRPVYLRYRPKRYRCDDCDGHPTTTQQLTWHEPNSSQTTAYDTHLLLQLVNATVEDVSLKEQLAYDAVLGVIERRIENRVDWTLYTDMYEGYIQAVREVLSHVRIVIDRFHVAQKYRDAADSMRKRELKRLKQELPKAEYQQLKGSLWAFRKNQVDLQPEEQERLACLFAYSPVLEMAYTLREELTTIFQQAPSLAQAQEQIRAWQTRVRQSGLSCFDDFLNTLDPWGDEITGYFVQRNTSGF